MVREQRRLAAVVAADVVGYSRLVGRDEAGTVARLREHRAQRLEPALARHGGRLVKTTGDGALIEFTSAVGALSAAIEFQQAMEEANGDQPPDAAVVFRIGVHLGDLLVDGDDLYGDGVNVAARLEAEAPAGGILISRTVHEAVAGRLKASFDDLGGLALKNIDRLVQAFRVNWRPEDWKAAASPTVLSAEADAPLALPDKPSIAVLPFENMSGDIEQEYFVDGLVEDVITELSRFRSLFVIARNSSFTYKGKVVDIKQVGQELGVRYVLEGSVRKAGNRLRITGQLIECATGAHIWADRYDGNSAEVFDLQDKVTLDVVGAITSRLDLAEIERSRRKPTASHDAYDFYLRGMASFYSATPDGIREARQLCYRAMERDPGFAMAYAMVAFCDAALVANGVKPDQAAVAETSRLARRAVELDRNDAVVLCRAAWAHAHVMRDLDASSGHTELALALNPNLALAWMASGWMNVWAGKPDVAVERFAQATRLSPLDPNQRLVRLGVAHAHFMAGRNDEALLTAEKALAMWRTVPTYRIAAASAALAGRPAEAREFTNVVLELEPGRRVSNLIDVLGPYRRAEDVERYKEGLRLAGLPE